jgi:glycosyltransferase involved in cell wall biosynthesis
MQILALIPAYNAERTLAKVLSGVKKYLPDILVVDDGSGDKTALVAQKRGVRVLRHPHNQGKGAALITGFRYALEEDYDLILTIDADGQHNPELIPDFLRAYRIHQPGIIIGSRWAQAAQMKRIRQFSNKVARAAISACCKTPLEDSQSGYRLIDTAVLRKVKLTTCRYDTETELLIKATRAGFPIVTIPALTLFADGTTTSYFRSVPDTYRICIVVLRSLFW